MKPKLIPKRLQCLEQTVMYWQVCDKVDIKLNDEIGVQGVSSVP
ncbi:hypothetical protein O9992_29565 [Vibrio lentus]|nr:hypothetical protein [Vibrio lentus]